MWEAEERWWPRLMALFYKFREVGSDFLTVTLSLTLEIWTEMGANHWQIINLAPWRWTLLVYLDILEENERESHEVRRIVSWQDKRIMQEHVVEAVCVSWLSKLTSCDLGKSISCRVWCMCINVTLHHVLASCGFHSLNSKHPSVAHVHKKTSQEWHWSGWLRFHCFFFHSGQSGDLFQEESPQKVWRQHHLHQLHPQTGTEALTGGKIMVSHGYFGAFIPNRNQKGSKNNIKHFIYIYI